MYKTLTISLVALAAAAANAHNITDSFTGNYPEGFKAVSYTHLTLPTT